MAVDVREESAICLVFPKPVIFASNFIYCSAVRLDVPADICLLVLDETFKRRINRGVLQLSISPQARYKLYLLSQCPFS
jgi:hypothetical protein